eukprot:scaffold7504_cov860-Prasinococcus_capsulatus_cf.AAC.1
MAALRGACVRRAGKGLGVEPRVAHGVRPARSASIDIQTIVRCHERTLVDTRPALSADIDLSIY